MRPGLKALGAVNLVGAESGFVYAKLPVSVGEEQIAKCVAEVRNLAEIAEVRIDIIHLDASADVEVSKHYTLWTGTDLE